MEVVSIKTITIKIGDVATDVALLEDEAPVAVAALWDALPIVDEQSIPTQWSGRAWRTLRDYPLVPWNPDEQVENLADRLVAGDLIFYPRSKKIGFAFDEAKWLGPYKLDRQVTLIGQATGDFVAVVDACMQIIYQGPLPVEISKAS